MSRAPRMFGIKDIFTTINLMGGVVGICFCIAGRPFEAGVSIMLGYLFGDTLDGYVARKLGTSNQFGAEYDTISDHLSHVIAPAAVVFTVYKDAALLPEQWMNYALAGFLCACIIVSVSIRHARAIVQPINYKGIWTGLPRSVLGFLAIGYCNATLAPHAPGGWWLGVVLIPVACIATLRYWPFPNHHLLRGHWWIVNASVWAFLLSSAAMIFWKPRFAFDVITFWMVGYSLAAWISLTPAERLKHKNVVRVARGLPPVDVPPEMADKAESPIAAGT
jgi:phosphatidylserine synthase